MKNALYLGLITISFLLSGCMPDNPLGSSTTPTLPKVDYDGITAKLMNDLTPQVVGRWTLKRVHIKIQSYNHSQKKLQLSRDTVFQNLATLEIRSATKARFSPKDPRHAEFEGSIQYRSKTYPIYFYLRANAERVIADKGPQAFFGFEYSFPNGTRIPESEETYLEDLGVVGDNFSLEVVAGQPAMIWRGLNRGVDRIELQK